MPKRYDAIVGVRYDICWDAYFIAHNGKELMLPEYTCDINGLLDGRPFDDIPEHETRRLEKID